MREGSSGKKVATEANVMRDVCTRSEREQGRIKRRSQAIVVSKKKVV